MAKRRRVENGSIGLNTSSNQIIEISNRFEVFRFDLNTGRFSIIPKKKTGGSVKDAHACVILSDGNRLRTSDKWSERKWEKTSNKTNEDKEISLTITNKSAGDRKLGNTCLVLTVELSAKNPATLLRVELLNDSGRLLRVKEFQPLAVESAEGGFFTLGSSTRNWRFLKNGYQTSSPCYSMSLTELDKTCSVEYFRKNYNPRSKYKPVKGEFDSEWMTAFRDNSTNNSAVIGFVTMKDNMCQVDFKLNERQNKIVGLWARSISDNIACKDGTSARSEKLLIDIVGSLTESLDQYADAVAAEMNSVPWKAVLTGWCSWYEFYEKISEHLILDVIEYYRRNREKYPIEYIQVDDGYFTHRGDWTTPNRLFPHGMKYIADKIRAAGFRPGIWLSPFQISAGSKLFKEHPDWTIRDEKRNPIGEGIDASMKYSLYGLDCTNPAVIDWLKNLFKTITKDWGYEYLKIDFLHAAALDGLRCDRNATRAQALRRGLEAIRETVGDGIPVLGCLAPMGQTIGMVNSYRISPDTATRWKPPMPFECEPALGNAMRNTILRYFMHNKFWVNDPDCVIARRGKARSEFPKSAEFEFLGQGGTMSEDEVRFEVTVLGILGGSIFYSDDPIHLPPEREKYLPLLLPVCQGKARVVDLLEGDLPVILNLKISKSYDEWDLVGLLNWSESAQNLVLELSRIGLNEKEYYHVFSFWDEKYIGKIKGRVQIENIPAHSASLLSIRKVRDTPQLLSSSIHVTQGGAEIESAVWNAKERALDIMLTHPGRRSGKLFIHVPPSFKFNSVYPQSAVGTLQKTGGAATLLVVDLDFKESARVSIRFD